MREGRPKQLRSKLQDPYDCTFVNFEVRSDQSIEMQQQLDGHVLFLLQGEPWQLVYASDSQTRSFVDNHVLKLLKSQIGICCSCGVVCDHCSVFVCTFALNCGIGAAAVRFLISTYTTSAPSCSIAFFMIKSRPYRHRRTFSN